MNRVMAMIVLAAVALPGCSKTSEKGGVAGNETFRLTVPATATLVKQGEVATVRVSVERGAGFKQPVALIIKAPTGLRVEPADIVIQPDAPAEVQLTITAAADAAIGEHLVLVSGTPGRGEATETQFKITVSAR